MTHATIKIWTEGGASFEGAIIDMQLWPPFGEGSIFQFKTFSPFLLTKVGWPHLTRPSAFSFFPEGRTLFVEVTFMDMAKVAFEATLTSYFFTSRIVEMIIHARAPSHSELPTPS